MHSQCQVQTMLQIIGWIEDKFRIKLWEHSRKTGACLFSLSHWCKDAEGLSEFHPSTHILDVQLHSISDSFLAKKHSDGIVKYHSWEKFEKRIIL